MSIWAEIKRLWRGRKSGELAETASVIPAAALPATSPASGGRPSRTTRGCMRRHGPWNRIRGAFGSPYPLVRVARNRNA